MDRIGTIGPSGGQTKKESAFRQIAQRRPSKASRNQRVNASTLGYRHQILDFLAAPAPQTGTGGPSVGQTVKESAFGQNALRGPSKASRNQRVDAGILDYRHRILGFLAALVPQTGIAGPSVGQTVKESAFGQIAFHQPSKASRDCDYRAVLRIMVNARQADGGPDGLVEQCKFARRLQRCSIDKNLR
jgi:hypothetical protein